MNEQQTPTSQFLLPEPEYPTLEALLAALAITAVDSNYTYNRDINAESMKIQCVHAPYPSDHARTLLIAGRAGQHPTYAIKIARQPSSEPYLHNATILRPHLPERFGKLRLIFPQWEGRVAGRLATVEPYLGTGWGAWRVGRGVVAELLREWLAVADEFGPALADLPELQTERIEPDALADFLQRYSLSSRLAATIDRHADWLMAEPTLCHGDLTHHNVLRAGDDLCLIDWDFCRRVSLRRFDAFYALLAACMPFTTYPRLLRRYAVLIDHHGEQIGWTASPEDALALILTSMAMHSEAKDRSIVLPPESSPFLRMLASC